MDMAAEHRTRENRAPAVEGLRFQPESPTVGQIFHRSDTNLRAHCSTRALCGKAVRGERL